MRYLALDLPKRVSRIGLGTWQFGSREWGYDRRYADVEAPRIVRRALELGVTLFDTAEIYGLGRSERILGAALAERREDVFLATKLFPLLPLAPVVEQRGVASARRLGVRRLDLYQVHQPNPLVRERTTMRGMRTLQDVGLVGDGTFSRELCGGTHVRSTAEIGLFRIVSETSSAANVRRIEALTGPGAVELVRSHDDVLRAVAQDLRAVPEQVPHAVSVLQSRVKELEKAAKGGGSNGAADLDALLASATDVGGASLLAAVVDAPDPKTLPDLADRLKAKLGDSAVVLGAVADGKVHLVASVAPALVARGVKAGAVVKVAAEVTGGGGGGRDTMARAGGKDPDKLPEAIAAARAAIEAALAS